MSDRERMNHLEEEFDKHFSSARGAWTNAWSPTWEDAMPPESSHFGKPWEDFSKEYKASAAPDDEPAA